MLEKALPHFLKNAHPFSRDDSRFRQVDFGDQHEPNIPGYKKLQLAASLLISYTAKAILTLLAELKWIAAHGSRRSTKRRRL